MTTSLTVNEIFRGERHVQIGGKALSFGNMRRNRKETLRNLSLSELKRRYRVVSEYADKTGEKGMALEAEYITACIKLIQLYKGTI